MTTLMFLAGLLYSSWPLAYWLNPSVESRLASDLEALHQPFNWVFIWMDIGSGLFTVIGCWKLVRLVAAENESFEVPSYVGLLIAIYGAATFGLFTAIDAIMPLNCLDGTPRCRSPLHNPYFVIHGIFSIGSIAGLSVSIIAIWLILFFRNEVVKSLAHLTTSTFLIAALGFGILTFYLVLHNESSGLAQHFFIGFCSLWIITLPHLTQHLLHVQPICVD